MVFRKKIFLLNLIYSIILGSTAFLLGIITAEKFTEKKQVQAVNQIINYTEKSLKVSKQEALYKKQQHIYPISTYRRSYFKLDNKGAFELASSMPYRSEGIYRQNHIINSNTNALIVMDPWIDMPSRHLNEYYGKIFRNYILPLVKSAHKRGHPVIILTNDCKITKYSCKVDPQLEKMAAQKQINIIFHQDYDEKEFADYLRKQGITSLTYTGFASNLCLIGRKMGMISMQMQGFPIFFVPKASAAVEISDTWDDQTIHRQTTTIISQWIAQIVDYDEMMGALSEK